MKLPNLAVSRSLIITIGLTVAVATFGINRQPVYGVLVVLAVEVARWWRRGQLSSQQILNDSWLWLSGVSMVVIIVLNPVFLSDCALAILFGLWRWWLTTKYRQDQDAMLAAGLTQGLMLWAIFLGAAVWHWSTIIILGLTWLGSWIVSRQALELSKDRASGVLAVSWALIVAECSWIFSLWLVNYIIFNGALIIPQPALVLTALGYCLAGIYVSHRKSQLSRTRLVEYLMVGLVILVVVIAGTKWNGVI